jgi:hypothetical protein
MVDEPEAAESLWLLDWNCDGHLSRDDVAMSLVNIAVYPKPEDLDEFMTALGDGTPASFTRMLAQDPQPIILRDNTNIWRDLAVMRDRQQNLLSPSSFTASYWRNVGYMFMALLAFPLNLVFARSWTRKIGMHDVYWAWYKKYPQLSYICFFLELVMVTLHAHSPGELAPEIMSFFAFMHFGITAISIFYEAGAWMPSRTKTKSSFFMLFSASYFHAFQVHVNGRDETVNVRDFLEEHLGDYRLTLLSAVKFSDAATVRFKSAFGGRQPTRQSIVHASDSESAYATRMAADLKIVQEAAPKGDRTDRGVSLLMVTAVVASGCLKITRKLGATDIICIILTSLMMLVLEPSAYAVLFRLGPKENLNTRIRARKFVSARPTLIY